jgi:hypothetical protein
MWNSSDHEFRTLAKMGALLPYRRARSLLEEFFPLGDAPEVETIRHATPHRQGPKRGARTSTTRTMRVGARLERDAVAPFPGHRQLKRTLGQRKAIFLRGEVRPQRH